MATTLTEGVISEISKRPTRTPEKDIAKALRDGYRLERHKYKEWPNTGARSANQTLEYAKNYGTGLRQEKGTEHYYYTIGRVLAATSRALAANPDSVPRVAEACAGVDILDTKNAERKISNAIKEAKPNALEELQTFLGKYKVHHHSPPRGWKQKLLKQIDARIKQLNKRAK